MKRILLAVLVIVGFGASVVDALEVVRQKNVATYIVFPMTDVNGDPVTSMTSPDSEIDTFADGAAPDGFADCTNEATEIGSDGQYYLSLTQAEMNVDYAIIQIKASDAKKQTILIRTTIGDPLNYATTDDGTTINVTGGAIDTVTTNTDMRGTDSAATAVELAETDANVALVLADTDDIGTAGAGLTDLGGMSTAMKAEIEAEVDDSIGAGTGTSLTAIVWNSDWDAEVESEVEDAVGADVTSILGYVDTEIALLVTEAAEADANLAAIIEDTGTTIPGTITTLQADSDLYDTDAEYAAAIWDALIDSYDDTDNAFGNLLSNVSEDDGGTLRFTSNALEQAPGGVTYAVDSTVATSNTTTSFTLAAGKASNDAYNDMIISVTDAGDGNIEVRRVSDWTSGLVVTVDTAYSFTPDVGDVVHIVENAYAAVSVSGGDATEAKQDAIIAELAEADANSALILADTGELQTDWANGGRLDLLIDSIITATTALLEDTALWDTAAELKVYLFGEDANGMTEDDRAPDME